ncbi:MAG: hypothetical protein GX837_06675 [Methanomicrobiales archaeon]|jgi:hypothetical protein|nr:hypothetical protein [Methanomicrobiales archaeon]
MRQTIIVPDAGRPLGDASAALINELQATAACIDELQAQGNPIDLSIAGCPIGATLGDILPEAAGGLAAAMIGTEIQIPRYQEVRR